MVKIFIGNLSPNTEKDKIEALFTKYGPVTECAKYKNYAFVHMDDRKTATKAIRELHLHKVDGRPINVEPSRGKGAGPIKLHIANVEQGFDKELREMFEEYGEVTECAIVKNFAFVHMSNSDEAMDALKDLDNSDFQGKRIHVQISKSRPRGYIEEEEEEYPPPSRGGGGGGGGGGYFPFRYPADRPEPPYRGRMSGAYPPPPLPPPPQRRASYPESGYADRDAYGVVDYYQKYRAHPYARPSYEERRPAAIPPPPPPSAMVREHLRMGSGDPYERRSAAPPPAAPYMVRDRSPIRRAPLPPPAGNGYSYERSRLSPTPRVPMYSRPRESYSERLPPPPPPPRYAGY